MAEIGILAAAEVLFGGNLPLRLKTVLTVLLEEKIPLLSRYQRILAICQEGGKSRYDEEYKFGRNCLYRVIAKIITAVTASDPQSAILWLGILESAFLPDDHGKYSLPGGSGVDFFFGVPLGVLNSALYLDKQGLMKRDFETKLCSIMTDLIIWKGEIPGCLALTHQPNTECEAEFSQAIKAYFRVSGAESNERRESRLVDARRIMEGVATHRRILGKEGDLTKLGEMILRQICFAVAGPMDPVEFAAALSSHEKWG